MPLDREGRIVTIDCGGVVHKTFLKTLLRHPGTLLWEMAQPEGELYDDGAVFLDRDAGCFAHILNYYRTGRLAPPQGVPEDMWHVELVFFKIENPMYRIPTAEDIDEEQQLIGKPPEPGVRKTVWLLFEDPSSSTAAKWLSFFSIFVIVMGVAAFITETHPTVREPIGPGWFGVSSDKIRVGFQRFEWAVVFWFTLELVVRFVVTFDKRNFLSRFINWVDIVAVLPFYIALLLNSRVTAGSSSIVVRSLRLARVFRILGLVFKLGKYSHGVRVLIQTFRTCVMELSILSVLLVMAVVMISSGMYFCENPDLENIESDFTSISRAMYFSMISVTTIGYGDMSPLTNCGEFVACMAGLSGIFVLGLPISIIGVKFQQRYDEMLREKKIIAERDRLKVIEGKIAALKGMKVLATTLLPLRHPSAGTALTPEETKTIEDKADSVFETVDVDRKGEISLDDVGLAMKMLGMEIEEDVLQVMMIIMDDDSSGSVDKREFSGFVVKCVTGDLPTTQDLLLSKQSFRPPEHSSKGGKGKGKKAMSPPVQFEGGRRSSISRMETFDEGGGGVPDSPRTPMWRL